MPEGEGDEEPHYSGGGSEERCDDAASRVGRPGEADFCHGWEARHHVLISYRAVGGVLKCRCRLAVKRLGRQVGA